MDSVKVAILAGGVGSRLAEETETKPKPMVEIGGRPILWHIMAHYRKYFDCEFRIALGYKGEHIKKLMIDYCQLANDITVNFGTGEVTRYNGNGLDANWSSLRQTGS